MSPRWLAPFVVASLLFDAGELRADAINGPPDDCAKGSVGVSSHQGEWCQPQPCETDVDCKQIWTQRERVDGKCESTSLCIGTRKVYPHHRSGSDAGPRDQPIATKACGRLETCGGGAVCETAKRCVVPSTSKVSVDNAKRGCGCGKTSGTSKSGALVGLVVGLWLLRRNRR